MRGDCEDKSPASLPSIRRPVWVASSADLPYTSAPRGLYRLSRPSPASAPTRPTSCRARCYPSLSVTGKGWRWLRYRHSHPRWADSGPRRSARIPDRFRHTDTGFPVALLKGRMYAGNPQRRVHAFDTHLRDNIHKVGCPFGVYSTVCFPPEAASTEARSASLTKIVVMVGPYCW